MINSHENEAQQVNLLIYLFLKVKFHIVFLVFLFCSWSHLLDVKQQTTMITPQVQVLVLGELVHLIIQLLQLKTSLQQKTFQQQQK